MNVYYECFSRLKDIMWNPQFKLGKKVFCHNFVDFTERWDRNSCYIEKQLLSNYNIYDKMLSDKYIYKY